MTEPGLLILDEDTACPACGFNLRESPSRHRCPECGTCYDIPTEFGVIERPIRALAERHGFYADAVMLMKEAVAWAVETTQARPPSAVAVCRAASEFGRRLIPRRLTPADPLEQMTAA